VVATHDDLLADLTAQVEVLRDRIQRLEDERAIVDVLHAYGPALDDGDEEAWGRCFTSDAVWETTGPGVRRVHHLEGRDELVAFARRHTRAPEHLHKHCVFGSRLEVDCDTARSVSYFVRVDALPDGPAVFAMGRYHDDLRRDVDGTWRITRRRAEVEATGPRRA
jgi:hypothetical protein